MKTCPHCQSTAFDDMAVCYGCLQPFDEPMSQPAALPPSPEVEDLLVEEPTERGQVARAVSTAPVAQTAQVAQTAPAASAVQVAPNAPSVPSAQPAPTAQTASLSIRLHVAMPDLFGYDIYLCKEEGAQLTIGCARDNNIVLPHTESKRHLLRLYYMQGQVWVEDISSTQQALVDNVPLTGTRCLKPSTLLKIGEATIEIVEE
jgi:hypothetical protein